MGKAITETVFKAAIKRALAEGEAKGRRMERRSKVDNTLLERLWIAACSVLHHDSDETRSEAHRWAHEQLTKKFKAILSAASSKRGRRKG